MARFDDFFQAISRVANLGRSEKLSDRELADLGLSRADFQALRSGSPGARERIVAMASQFGLSEEALDSRPELSLELAEKCGYCDQAKTCRDAIRKGEHLPEDRCPNANIYRALSGS